MITVATRFAINLPTSADVLQSCSVNVLLNMNGFSCLFRYRHITTVTMFVCLCVCVCVCVCCVVCMCSFL